MRLVCGIGINDLKNKTLENGKQGKDYQLWRDMLRRSCGDVSSFAREAYSESTCSSDWLVLSKFIDDISSKTGYKNENWHLDKDVLIKGNKHYSNETTCFIPKEINNLLTKNNANRGDLPIGVYFDSYRNCFNSSISINGKQKRLGRFSNPIDAFYSYKEAKEFQVKMKAKEYVDFLDKSVFDALINYKVEIND